MTTKTFCRLINNICKYFQVSFSLMNPKKSSHMSFTQTLLLFILKDKLKTSLEVKMMETFFQEFCKNSIFHRSHHHVKRQYWICRSGNVRTRKKTFMKLANICCLFTINPTPYIFSCWDIEWALRVNLLFSGSITFNFRGCVGK